MLVELNHTKRQALFEEKHSFQAVLGRTIKKLNIVIASALH
jgi:hypothetical protein